MRALDGGQIEEVCQVGMAPTATTESQGLLRRPT